MKWYICGIDLDIRRSRFNNAHAHTSFIKFSAGFHDNKAVYLENGPPTW